MTDKPVAAGKSSFDLIDTEKVFAALAVKPDARFLDAACGIGKYSTAVASRMAAKGTVYAVDLWREGIEALNRQIDIRGIKNIETIVADIRKKLPLEENSIDACLMATILHDLSQNDQKATVQEIARLLKPGGMLHIIEFKKIDQGPGPPLKIRMAEAEIDDLVRPHGFEKVAGSEVGAFNYLVQFRKAEN